VDEAEVSEWFDEYLDVFAACGRGERQVDSLLAYYGVPLLFSGNDGHFALTSDEQVSAAVQRQVDGMLADHYDRSEVLGFHITLLNSACALYQGRFSRRRRDGSEIRQLAVTYVITAGPHGRRISVLAYTAPEHPDGAVDRGSTQLDLVPMSSMADSPRRHDRLVAARRLTPALRSRSSKGPRTRAVDRAGAGAGRAAHG
jgi:hypothetical protein